jgi:hypothetical protein
MRRCKCFSRIRVDIEISYFTMKFGFRRHRCQSVGMGCEQIRLSRWGLVDRTTMGAPGGAVRSRGDDDRDAACLHDGRITEPSNSPAKRLRRPLPTTTSCACRDWSSSTSAG